MRIGFGVGLGGNTGTLADYIEQIERAEADGFETAWIPHLIGRAYDALTVLALAGARTSRIELGTAVVPTYLFHPTALAQLSLTTQAASNGRLLLGIGLSHQVTIEGMLGLDWSRPIHHLREYLAVLRPAIAGEAVDWTGESYRVANYRLALTDAPPPPVLVAALGPQMLRLAGRHADGTIIWMGGPTYLARHCVPVIGDAASAAGRPAPRVVAGLPICVTDDADSARRHASDIFARYGQLPSYRAVLDLDGSAGPEDVALIGNEAELWDRLAGLAAAGVTDFNPSVFAAPGAGAERTVAFLRGAARAAN